MRIVATGVSRRRAASGAMARPLARASQASGADGHGGSTEAETTPWRVVRCSCGTRPRVGRRTRLRRSTARGLETTLAPAVLRTRIFRQAKQFDSSFEDESPHCESNFFKFLTSSIAAGAGLEFSEHLQIGLFLI